MNRTLTRLSRFAADPTLACDAGLLDAFVTSQDGTAFEALVRRHGPMVLAVCRRVLRHAQDTEDAFQATFLVLARRAADVWPREAVGSWLYGVAYRVALKARTARARRVGRERPLGETVQPVAEANPPSDLMDVIDRAIRKLPEVYRAAVVACDLEGRSRKEAAEQLGWKEGTLSGRLARARVLLATRLRRAGFTLPSGGIAAVLGVGSTADALPPALLGRVFSFAVVNAAVGVPPPVAALTEGVVRTMFVAKLKVAAVMVLAAGAIGFGAWSSAGAGDGPGESPAPRTRPTAATKRAKAADPADVKKTFGSLEMELLQLMLDQAGRRAPETPEDFQRRLDEIQARLDAAKKLVDRARAQAQFAEPPPPAPKIEGDPALLQGRWQIDSVGSMKTDQLKASDRPPPVEIRGNTLSMPFRDTAAGWKRKDYKIAIDPTKRPQTIDFYARDMPLGHGIYEFEQLAGRTFRGVGLKLAIGSARRPSGFEPAEGVTVFRLTRVVETRPGARASKLDAATIEAARKKASEAAGEVDAARQELAVAKVVVVMATARLQDAEGKLAEARKRAEDAEQALRGGPGGGRALGVPAPCTIRVRLLDAPEKAIPIPLAAGKLTVLDALKHSEDVVAFFRVPDRLSAWVLRKKAVMPVDVAAIVSRNETATNYVLRPGDQVFVQVKLGK